MSWSLVGRVVKQEYTQITRGCLRHHDTSSKSRCQVSFPLVLIMSLTKYRRIVDHSPPLPRLISVLFKDKFSLS